MPVPPTHQVTLLEADPELGAALSAEEFEQARPLLVLPGYDAPVGEWDVAAIAQGPSLGLLMLKGLVTVNVVIGDRVASWLAGTGDVLHATSTPDALVPAGIRHHVSQRAEVAVLDRRFLAAVRRWPTLLLALYERQRVHERRLAVHAAIGKLRRVEDRVLALLWHLAERWGRMTAEGVVVPLALTHETIGRLAGAERPTVTLALRELAATGQVVRRRDGSFVLRHGSADGLASARESMPQVRALAVEHVPLTDGLGGAPVSGAPA